MPIEVRHDAPGGALARLAALSGLTQQQNVEAAREQQAFLTVQGREQQDRQQARALAAQRDRQQEQIQAAAQRQMQAADDAAARTALQFGLEGQVKEDAFNRELETIKASAKASAEQWEYQYTAKQRADIARMNDAKQRLVNNPNIDPVTKKRMTQALDAQIAGVSPGLMPADPNKPSEEQTPGYRWEDEYGSWMINKDGEPRLEIEYKNTPRGIQAANEHAIKLKQLDIQDKRLKEKQAEADAIRKFMFEQGQGEFEGDKPSPASVESMAVQRFGAEAMREFKGQGLQQTSEAPRAELTTGELEQELQQRVSAVKQAKAFLKEMEKKYKNVENIPPEVLAEIMKADEIVKRSKGR